MAPSGRGKREAKRQRREAVREARREERHRDEARRRRRSLAVYGVVGLIVALGGGLLAWSAVRPRVGAPSATGAQTAAGVTGARSTPRPTAREIPDQGRDHVRLSQPHPPYNSNPPTSGWHTPETVAWGVHRIEIPDEILVHNLEHGGIWISYKDPSDTALIGQLEALVSRYRSKVVVTPRAANDARIALAAWTRLLKLDAYDEGLIVEFINAYRNKGPEQVPD